FLIAIGSWLLVAAVALVAGKLGSGPWIAIGLLLLPSLLLPASLSITLFPDTNDVPFQLILIPSAALVVAALLLNAGMQLLSPKADGESFATSGRKRVRGWMVFALAALVLAAALYNIYWFMIWDSTYDPIDILLLPFPILAALVASLVLLMILPGRAKVVGVVYPFITIGLVVGVSVLAWRVDFRQLTEARAERVTQALERYRAREGRYPQDLQQLTPIHLLALGEPIIIYGQPWCYDGGDAYYRLGYVYREHWSAPQVTGHRFSSGGNIPELPPLCEDEIDALIQRDRFLSHILEDGTAHPHNLSSD
ncbi:MAG TPA: hypothetical protein VK879_06575, partial [Candidatus Sulfomarinibacteraceae bacterium]|nr:hypothetical protein [Candidatus Sulfomarinibacteraceae bacterium]